MKYSQRIVTIQQKVHNYTLLARGLQALNAHVMVYLYDQNKSGNIYGLLNMQSKPEVSNTYSLLFERIAILLSRENLCSNLYLSRFIKASLVIPLYAFAEERSIQQITTNEELVIKAIEETRLAKVVNRREVHLIAYPTVKFPYNNQALLKEIETVLNQLQKQYSFGRRSEADFVNLTIYDDDANFLDRLMSSLSVDSKAEKVDLYEDIRQGTAVARKNKQQNLRSHPNRTYSLDNPPQIFIRRAIDSQEDEPEKQRHKYSKNTDKKRRYKEVVRESEKPTEAKALFSNEDFPVLS